VTVNVSFESGGRVFKGTGAADEHGSLYSSAYKRALRVALDRALADATQHASEPAASSLPPAPDLPSAGVRSDTR
jgi:hypothetical protein